MLPDLQRPDLTLEPQRPGALDRQHPQRVLSVESSGGRLGQETRVPYAHDRIGAEADAQAGPTERREGCGPVTVSPVGPGAVSDASASVAQQFDILLVHLHAVDAETSCSTLHDAKLHEVLDGRAAARSDRKAAGTQCVGERARSVAHQLGLRE